MSQKAIVIGSGFSGLAAATALAHEGVEVEVLEKNDQIGGRARTWKHEGFTFDMGPSWYWMPDVFEKHFSTYGKSVSDYYDLTRLDPSYRVFFGKDDNIDIPANMEGIHALFESIEKGSGNKLRKFLKEAETKYRIGMRDLVYKPGFSLTEFASASVLKNVMKLNIFQSFHGYIRKYFKHPHLLQLLEFPVLFLGAMPSETPALYSLMNYADMNLGTWYPKGGMHKIVEGLAALAAEKGVVFNTSQEAIKINVNNQRASSIDTLKGSFQAQHFIGSADYHHIEQRLLDEQHRNYSESYWDKKTFSPSSLIFYVGLNKKLKNLLHHNLFFDQDFALHARELYKEPAWPSKPLFYVSCPSVTDSSVAPEGQENMFILIPVAPGLEDNEATREKYFNIVMDRIEHLTGQSVKSSILFKRSYAHNDFKDDYNAYKGNAYGLANTLRQTAILKPSMRNKNVKNLYYTGQLTVPGPGVPPALISGKIAADQILKSLN